MKSTRYQEIRGRIRLAWSILSSRDDNLVRHVLDETAHMRLAAGPDEWMSSALVDIARVFGTQGHSGFSAAWCVGSLERLLRFQPLGPLTGEEHEWVPLEYDEDMAAQNRRCGHVFRRADGSAYDSEAVIFREPNGCCFTSIASRRDVDFPYTPRKVYADVPANATDEQKAAAAEAAWAGA